MKAPREKWVNIRPPLRNLHITRHLRGKKAKGTSPPWWKSVLEKHPIRILSLSVLTVGGILLLMFFAHLGELPDLDLATSTSILAAVALIGLLVSALFGGSAGNLNTTRDLEWLRTPVSLRVVAIPGATLVLLFLLQVVVGSEWLPAANAGALCSGLCLIAGYARVEHLAATDGMKEEYKSGKKLHFAALTFAVHSFLWTLSLIIGLVCLTVMFPHGTTDSEVLLSIVAWGCFSIGLSIALAQSKPDKQLKNILAVTLAGLLILVTLTKNYTGLAVASVRALGLGDVPVKLVLTERGCQIINAAASRVVCQFNEREKVGVVCPAVLRSKIGTPFIVGLSPFTESGGWPDLDASSSIPISRSEVLSWPRIKTRKKPQIGSPSKVDEKAARPIAANEQRDGLDEGQKEWLDGECGAFRQSVRDPAPAASQAQPSSKLDGGSGG
jgi:hypothetical protein